jgi:hypothetical protein
MICLILQIMKVVIKSLYSNSKLLCFIETMFYLMISLSNIHMDSLSMLLILSQIYLTTNINQT